MNNFHNRRIEDDDYMESLEIVVDCSTLKGKLFSALSKNKGVTIDNRDFPRSRLTQRDQFRER